MRHPSLLLCVALAAASGAPASAGAQRVPLERLPLLAGEQDELGRVQSLLVRDSLRPQSLRAPSRLLAPSPSHFSAIAPQLTVGANSNLPWGFNDGAAWQGRGLNVSAMAGFVARWGKLRLVVAPQFVSAQNLAFQVVPYPQSGPDSARRSVWANPFHPFPAGIDLPLRFGDRAVSRVDPGQSSLTFTTSRVEFGLSTENVWWGPAMQDAITLGPQAPGVPSAFVRTSRPLRTRAGRWDAWLNVGSLRESDYFDADPANDGRSLAGFAFTWQPPHSDALEIGASRVVIGRGTPTVGAILSPFRSVSRPNGPDSLTPGTRDQVTSLWARWAQPGTGFEAWAEWARFEEPASIRDFLLFPGHSQGYTLGLQWATPVQRGVARVWAEATYLEPSASLRLRPVGASYVSHSVTQGFTQAGQPLGAGTGPGSSSQWIGGDLLGGRWRIGAYGARIRWDNAAFFTAVVPPEKREDISLVGGVRAASDFRGLRVALDWSHSVRLNYLFQAYLTDPLAGRTAGVDIVNDALSLTLSAPLHFRR